MRARAIFIIGPPGSGKSTQADAIARHFEEFEHIDTGRIGEKAIYDPKNESDPEIQLERKRFEEGLLFTTSWVLKLLKDHIEMIAESGHGVVFSGSPREREEAEVLVPFLFDLYGPVSIAAFHILVKEETSIFRNTHRRVCEHCRQSVVWSRENDEQAYCTLCGGKLTTRTVDTPEAIKTRLKVYEKRARAILDYLGAIGVPIFEINGEVTPQEVTNQLVDILARS